MRNCNFQIKIRKIVVEHDKDKSQHINETKCMKDKSSNSRRNAWIKPKTRWSGAIMRCNHISQIIPDVREIQPLRIIELYHNTLNRLSNTATLSRFSLTIKTMMIIVRHYTAPHCTALHCTALHCTALLYRIKLLLCCW